MLLSIFEVMEVGGGGRMESSWLSDQLTTSLQADVPRGLCLLDSDISSTKAVHRDGVYGEARSESHFTSLRDSSSIHLHQNT